MAASLAVPLLILIVRPIGLTLRQSAVVASVLLTIIWWSSGIVKKIPASLFLIAVFAGVSGAGMSKVFSFPLSETFPMIVITYLFSQAISNAGLIDKIFLPPLLKFVHTPLACLCAMILLFFATMFMIPQPLARVIIVAVMFDRFLKKTTLPDTARSVFMYAVFLMSAAVNMSVKDADIIMYRMATSFSETPISNGMWAYHMLVPTLVCCAVIVALFLFVFRKTLRGVRFEAREQSEAGAFTTLQKKALAVVAATVVLWMTQSLHGINATVVTVAATLLLFCAGVLHREDLKTIDVPTLIFLTAAFAIGGVMDACGAAGKVFGLLSGIFPEQFSVKYLWLMVLVGMLLHMMLGSNTTTLSVVVPGLMHICGSTVSTPVIVFTAAVSVSSHAVLPFHAISLMIGTSSGYFPAKYVTKMGIPMTFLIYLAAAFIYLPYWKFVGLM